MPHNPSLYRKFSELVSDKRQRRHLSLTVVFAFIAYALLGICLPHIYGSVKLKSDGHLATAKVLETRSFNICDILDMASFPFNLFSEDGKTYYCQIEMVDSPDEIRSHGEIPPAINFDRYKSVVNFSDRTHIIYTNHNLIMGESLGVIVSRKNPRYAVYATRDNMNLWDIWQGLSPFNGIINVALVVLGSISVLLLSRHLIITIKCLSHGYPQEDLEKNSFAKNTLSIILYKLTETPQESARRGPSKNPILRRILMLLGDRRQRIRIDLGGDDPNADVSINNPLASHSVYAIVLGAIAYVCLYGVIIDGINSINLARNGEFDVAVVESTEPYDWCGEIPLLRRFACETRRSTRYKSYASVRNSNVVVDMGVPMESGEEIPVLYIPNRPDLVIHLDVGRKDFWAILRRVSLVRDVGNIILLIIGLFMAQQTMRNVMILMRLLFYKDKC